MSVINGIRVAIPPPEGYVVDFDHPERQSVNASYTIASVGIALSTFFMCQRLYVKTALRNSLGVDDLLLVFAWIGSIGIQALIIYSFHATIMGVHGWEVPYETFRKFAIIGGYTTSIVYTVPTTLSKIVILLFYRQIENPQAWYRWSVNVAITVVAASGIAILFSSLFPCQPWAKSWDLNLATAPGHCIDRAAMYQATAGLGVATDIVIIFIPIPMVLSLRMSRATKIGLIAVFSVGSLTVVTSIVRLALLISILDSIDQTWGGGPVCMWICIEANLLIICASFSTVRHFFRAIAPHLCFSTTGASSKNASKKGSKKSSRSSSGNHELRTFGAGSSRNYYNRFDETDIGTDTVIGIQGLPPTTRPSNSNLADDGSDQGIIQTKETHVYYEYA